MNNNNFSSKKMKKRYTIGLFVDTLFENYELSIKKGINEVLENNNINLLCFIGGAIESPHYDYIRRNYIYDIINNNTVDGIISLSGSLGNYINKSKLSKFYTKFNNIPIVSVGIKFNNLPSIIVDNKSGMYELVNHMIKIHNYKKLVYINGPMGNPEAKLRLDIYKKVLKENNIKFNPDFVFPGNFSSECGKAAIRYFIDKKKIGFDAVISANDYMALDAKMELNRRGIKIPGDVAVTGFDNISESGYITQSLTTVSQPSIELGHEAAKTMINILNQNEFQMSKILPTKLIIRNSCGCSLYNYQDNINLRNKKNENFLINIRDFEETVFNEIYHLFNSYFINFSDSKLINKWINKLLTSLLNDIKKLKENKFQNTFKDIIRDAGNYGIEIVLWQDLIQNMFEIVNKNLSDINQINFNNHLCKQVILYIQTISRKNLEYYRITSDVDNSKLFQISQSFITIYNIETFKKIILEELPKFSIKNFYISLYIKEKNNMQNKSNLLIGYEKSKLIKYSCKNFLTYNLIPCGIKNIKERKTYIIIGLYFKDEQLGFIMLSNENIKSSIYETLAIQISSALKSALLFEEIQSHSMDLETKVTKRTNDLLIINEKLKAVINKRKRTLKILKKKNIEIQRLNEKLEYKSKLDSLTGLYNREAMFEFLEIKRNITYRDSLRIKRILNMEIEKNNKYIYGELSKHFGIFSLMMIDLDHFKKVNDTYGHLIGDEVLKYIGKLFLKKGVFREEDICGRFGGEEFIVILPNTNSKNAFLTANRLTLELSKKSFKSLKNEEFKITLSIGISQYKNTDKTNEEIIQRADQAMYYAKENGRNQIVIFEQIKNLII